MNTCNPQVTQPAPVTDADYRLMVEAVSDYAIFMLDATGRVRSWNAGAQRLKGYTADEVIGRSFEMFYPQDLIDIGLPQAELQGALALGRIEDEGWRLRKDGSRFWANVVITALHDAQGRHRGFAKVTRDLSARREYEEQLRQSEEIFRLMVEGVRDYAIFMLDPQGHVISWNLGAQITKGYTTEEIIGQHFSVFYPQEDRDRDWPGQELVMALRDGRFEDEGWRLRKDGSRFWANVVITALHDAQGRHRGFAKVTRDLTQHRRVDTLEHESRHLTRFIAVLGHELRNPLAAIANATTLLTLAESAPQRVRDVHGVLSRQVAHLRRLIDDLLDVGRIVSGKVHLERTPLCLQQVVEECVEASGPELDKRGQELAIDVDPEPLWVLGDKVRLVQVLNNLLHNAGKFTPEGGLVRVALRREGEGEGRAALHVSDTGCGIPSHELKRVFELFRQGEHTGTPGHGGLGIGLNLVRQIAQLHDGDVSAFSTGKPGEGAEFIVRLPLIDAPAGEAGS